MYNRLIIFGCGYWLNKTKFTIFLEWAKGKSEEVIARMTEYRIRELEQDDKSIIYLEETKRQFSSNQLIVEVQRERVKDSSLWALINKLRKSIGRSWITLKPTWIVIANIGDKIKD